MSKLDLKFSLEKMRGTDYLHKLTAKVGDEKVGSLKIQDFDRDATFVTCFSVLTEWRNKGIGTKILDEAVRLSKASGCTAFTLQVWKCNESAKRLYERYGMFVCVSHDREDSEGEPCQLLTMTKQI